MKLYVHNLRCFGVDFNKKAADALIKTIIPFCEEALDDQWCSELIANIVYGGDNTDDLGFDFILSSFSDASLTLRRLWEARANNEYSMSKYIYPGFEGIEGYNPKRLMPLRIEARYQEGKHTSGEPTFIDKAAYRYGFSLSKEEIKKQSDYAVAIICAAIRDSWN